MLTDLFTGGKVACGVPTSAPEASAVLAACGLAQL